MRLFISIPVPAELYAYLRELQAQFPGIRMVHDFHLTLQFLGDKVAADLRTIIGELSKISWKPFSISLEDLETFGHPRHPSGIWVSTRGGKELLYLVEDIHRTMQKIGLKADKPFSAHVTLGRYNDDTPKLPKVITFAKKKFKVHEFHLVESVPGPGGYHYQVIERFTPPVL